MAKGITCPVCGADGKSKVIDSIGDYSILHCIACDVEFANPMKNPGGEWYDRAYTIRHSALDTRIRDYYRWTVSNLPIRGKLLDVGCGEGVFVNYARKNGFDAYGVDHSEEAVGLGRRHFGLNTLHSISLSQMKENGISDFDAITFFEVLEHLENPRAFLGEVTQFLKARGYVALSVPNKGRWPVREFNDNPPHHLTWWTPAALRNFIEANGFEICSLRAGSVIRSYMIFLGYVFRVLVYRFFGIKKDFSAGRESKGLTLMKKPFLQRFLTALKPRQIRDILMWPLALMTYPLVFPFFKGYNLILIARRQG